MRKKREKMPEARWLRALSNMRLHGHTLSRDNAMRHIAEPKTTYSIFLYGQNYLQHSANLLIVLESSAVYQIRIFLSSRLFGGSKDFSEL